MKNVVSLDKFIWFKVGIDTLLVGEASWENLWVMKLVLRCFELASGLKVNFKKTRVLGSNVENEFLLQATDFLNCRVGTIPFTYLETWQRIVMFKEKKLGMWKGGHLSLGGRIASTN